MSNFHPKIIYTFNDADDWKEWSRKRPSDLKAVNIRKYRQISRKKADKNCVWLESWCEECEENHKDSIINRRSWSDSDMGNCEECGKRCIAYKEVELDEQA